MRGARASLCLVAAGAGVLLWACGDPDGSPSSLPSTAETARRRAASFYVPQDDRIPKHLATNPGTPWGDYLGSASCAECHAKEHAEWRSSFHSKTLYDAVPATVFGDFSGDVVFRDAKFPYVVRPYRAGGRMYVQVERNPAWVPSREVPEDVYGAGIPRPPEGRWEILYAFGNRRHQPYVTRDAEGRHWVLPVVWNDVVKEWHFDGWRPYASTCANCHVTGMKTIGQPVPGSLPIDFANPRRWTPPPAGEGWAEGSVGCELCHGPGRPHVETAKRLGREGYRAYLADGGAPTIYDPGKATPEERMRQCDSCHDFMAESPATWVPTPHGYDHEMLRVPIRPENDRGNQQFYPDGTDRSPCTVGRVFRGSKMGKAGVECRSCHHSHGNDDWADLRQPLANNRLCVECHLGTHAEFADRKALEAHTHHPADGPGSRCAECHMRRDKQFTNGIEIMSDLIYSHAFDVPTGHESPAGPGPSCNVCHVDRDADWTRRVLEAWKKGEPPPR
jgi:predicted CXXCH cytochrome family protein